MGRTSIFWFRNDLCLHDNDALLVAMGESEHVVPLYCFDPLDYGLASSGIEKTGPARGGFILECVASLRANLRARGSDLLLKIGNPIDVLLSVARTTDAAAVYAHQEVSHDEIQEEMEVASALQAQGIESRFFWGGTLIHVDDLPFKLEEMPTTFSGFRQLIRNVGIRPAIDAPQSFKTLPSHVILDLGDIPTLEELGAQPITTESKVYASVHVVLTSIDEYAADEPPFVGGENEALRILRNLCLGDLEQATAKTGEIDTSDARHPANFCNSLSPWLAIGCLSPQQMYQELKNSERLDSASSLHNGMLNVLTSELLWRDFLRFITKAYALLEKDADATKSATCLSSTASQ